MKDLLGREIKIGDVVAYAEARHADLGAGVVTGFTPKKVSTSAFFAYNKWDDTKETICTYDPERGGNLRDPGQVIILNTNDFKIMTNNEYYDMIKKESKN